MPLVRFPIAAAALFVASLLPAEDRPDILFIAIDDLNDWVGPLGHSQAKTPNMDRLAATSRVFNRHYMQVATCGASRHALLTGLPASRRTATLPF